MSKESPERVDCSVKGSTLPIKAEVLVRVQSVRDGWFHLRAPEGLANLRRQLATDDRQEC